MIVILILVGCLAATATTAFVGVPLVLWWRFGYIELRSRIELQTTSYAPDDANCSINKRDWVDKNGQRHKWSDLCPRAVALWSMVVMPIIPFIILGWGVLILLKREAKWLNGDLERRAKIKAMLKKEKEQRDDLVAQAIAELEAVACPK
jgi:hypothetical protein